MRIHLLPIAFIVGLIGLSPVQPKQKTGKKAVADGAKDDSNVQGNFVHLFDSINKNDAEKTGAYRTILEQEAARGQLAFDTMKGELQSARQKNVHKYRNSQVKDGNFVHFKRDAYDWAQPGGVRESSWRLVDSLTTKFLERICNEALKQMHQIDSRELAREFMYVPVHESRLQYDRVVRNAPISLVDAHRNRDKLTAIICTYMETTFYLARANATHVYRLEKTEDGAGTGPGMSIPPEYCAYIEASIREWKMDSFIATVNEQYKGKSPKTQKKCLESFNKLLTDCQFATDLQLEMLRPLSRLSMPAPYPHPDGKAMSTRTNEKAGAIDVRTTGYMDPSLTPLVVKLRYDKQVCLPFSGLVTFLDLEMFNELYPKQKIILLALSFSRSGDTAIRDWMALLYEDGKILDGQKSGSDCLNRSDYADLKYKDKHLKEYFKVGPGRC